jgi:hypothetical protein
MRPVLRVDNLTTFMCQLSRNLGASTSWNPKGLSRPVQGLLKRRIKVFWITNLPRLLEFIRIIGTAKV